MALMKYDEDCDLKEPCLSCDKAYIEDIWHEWCCDEKECSYKESEEQMSDIELVIKIDKDTYNNFICNKYSRDDVIVMHAALVNGVLISKGHGSKE